MVCRVQDHVQYTICTTIHFGKYIVNSLSYTMMIICSCTLYCTHPIWSIVIHFASISCKIDIHVLLDVTNWCTHRVLVTCFVLAHTVSDAVHVGMANMCLLFWTSIIQQSSCSAESEEHLPLQISYCTVCELQLVLVLVNGTELLSSEDTTPTTQMYRVYHTWRPVDSITLGICPWPFWGRTEVE